MKEIIVNSISEIPLVAAQLLELFTDHKIIAFYGEMGAGKTTFIKEICLQLDVKDNIASPTFSLINEYADDQGIVAYHFDFYRIEDISEAIDIGYENYFYSGEFCFIEWPEKIEQLLPEDHLKVEIKIIGQGSRKLLIHS